MVTFIKADSMRHTLQRIIFAAALLPGGSFALGLGKIETHSYLNAPLDAEIALVAADDVDLSDYRLRIIRDTDKRQAYSGNLFALESLRFNFHQSEKDKPVIRVTSKRTVREPFVTFTLELTGPKVRIQRDYTVLLDPKPYIRKASAKSAPATRRPRPQKPKPIKTAPKVQQESFNADVYGPVRGGETLSQIAQRTRPSSGVSTHQMTQALFRHNPQAFINGNINLLRKGARLAIPSREQIRQATRAPQPKPSTPAPQTAAPVTESVATAPPETKKPEHAEQSGIAESQLATAEEEATSTTSDAAKPQVEEESLLRLVPVSNEDLKQISDENQERLENELNEVSKQLDEVREENRLLRARLEGMEQILSELKEEAVRIVAEEQKIAAAEESATSAIPVPAAIEKPQPGPSPIEIATDTPAPVEPTPTDEKELSESSPDWILLIGLGIALIFALFALLWMRMREEEEHDLNESLTLSEAEDLIPHQPRPSPAEAAKERVALEEIDDTDESFAQQVLEEPKPLSNLEKLRTEIDTNIAYGRYSDAQNALDEALHESPSDIALILRALELALLKKDEKRFVAWVEEVDELLSEQAPEVWGEIRKRGQEWLPNHPVWHKDVSTPILDIDDFPLEHDDDSVTLDPSELDEFLLKSVDVEQSYPSDEAAADEELSQVLNELEALDLGINEDDAKKPHETE
jgi:pilus assembly protein FimV